MRISDWSSDVCSSDLDVADVRGAGNRRPPVGQRLPDPRDPGQRRRAKGKWGGRRTRFRHPRRRSRARHDGREPPAPPRSEEHTSELQSLMRISYAVFCLKKKKTHNIDLLEIRYRTNQ